MNNNNNTMKLNESLMLKETPKAVAQWSLDENFSISFSSTRKKPNIIVRTLQRWLLGIYWREVK
jgi:hypothetical protein